MGTKLSKVFNRIFNKSEPELSVSMLGLDNAGKTSILYQLKLNKHIQPMPTVGFNVETVRCGRWLLNIWDVSGGQPKTRVLWQHYNQHACAIIFVIDATDKTRIQIAKEEFYWLVLRPELSYAVFLIYANKQDLSTALNANDVVSVLELTLLAQEWAVQECCAMTGAGLWEGLQQLETMLENNRKLFRQQCT